MSKFFSVLYSFVKSSRVEAEVGGKRRPCNKSYTLRFIVFYNIASRAAQSNSVYVRVLQISIVPADGVSKSLCQNFFFERAAIVSVGKNIQIFRDHNG